MADRPVVQGPSVQADGGDVAVLRREPLREDGKGLAIRQFQGHARQLGRTDHVFSAAGLDGIDPQFLEMAKVFSLPRQRVLRRIVWPSLLPYLRSALCSALGLGWKAGIAAEVLTVPPFSIGKSIYEAKLYLETTELFAWTAAVVLLSFLIERVLLRLVDGIGRKELKDAQAS